jgi:unsaturated rhamnogalacturonyl hydrolase
MRAKMIFWLRCWLKSTLPRKVCMLICLLNWANIPCLFAQEHSLSMLTANRYIHELQDTLSSGPSPKVNAEDGYMLQAMDQVWQQTADGGYFRFFQDRVDRFLVLNDKNLFNLALPYGRAMLTLYKVTGQLKYFSAASLLWKQMQEQPEIATADVSLSLPFLAEYAALTGNNSAFELLSNQVLLLRNQVAARNAGLEYESSLGKAGFALVELLEYIPESNNRKVLLQFLNECSGKMEMILAGKSTSWSGLAPETRNRFLYTLCKAERLGYISKLNREIVNRGYAIVKVDNRLSRADKPLHFESADKGLSLLALNELELHNLPKPASRNIVVLDSYFNNETKTDQSGNVIRWHYKWEGRGDNGFSMWAGQFNRAGFQTSTLYTRPTATNLRNSSVYILVDPDTEKENKHPSYIAEQDVREISNWVKKGGVLVLMANDSANTELDNFNKLAGRFGVQFNKDSKGKVTGNRFDMGKIRIEEPNLVFITAKDIFIKEFSSLKISSSVQTIVKDKDGNIVIALSRFGKGSVLLIGDPWLYNEYVDGRKLPAEYKNFDAAADIVSWITRQLPATLSK